MFHVWSCLLLLHWSLLNLCLLPLLFRIQSVEAMTWRHWTLPSDHPSLQALYHAETIHWATVKFGKDILFGQLFGSEFRRHRKSKTDRFYVFVHLKLPNIRDMEASNVNFFQFFKQKGLESNVSKQMTHSSLELPVGCQQLDHMLFPWSTKPWCSCQTISQNRCEHKDQSLNCEPVMIGSKSSSHFQWFQSWALLHHGLKHPKMQKALGCAMCDLDGSWISRSDILLDQQSNVWNVANVSAVSIKLVQPSECFELLPQPPNLAIWLALEIVIVRKEHVKKTRIKKMLSAKKREWEWERNKKHTNSNTLPFSDWVVIHLSSVLQHWTE